LAGGFAALLSVLFGGTGLYYLAKATQQSSRWKINLLAGLLFLLASVLSLGAGYAAMAAAGALFAFAALKRLIQSRPIPHYKRAVFYVAWILGLLILVSHPVFQLRSKIIKAFFHAALVMGSVGSSSFDRNTALA